ncbi:MAG TPA: hypothetical protein VMM13_09930, partial [Euzebya sp.]|nr:hypothetical protein [Euzebya sp.]
MLLLAVLAARGPVNLPRPMIVAWAVLLIAMTAATITSVDPVHAWIGTPDRRLGLLSWVGFSAAGVVGSTLRTSGERRWVARSACLAGGLLGLGAGLDALGWLPVSGFASRLGGTYGQPAYLAAMATLLIPLAIAVAADTAAPRAWRLTAALAALGSTAALLASGTRGAWLGLGVGALPLLVRAARPARNRLPALALAAV